MTVVVQRRPMHNFLLQSSWFSARQNQLHSGLKQLAVHHVTHSVSVDVPCIEGLRLTPDTLMHIDWDAA